MGEKMKLLKQCCVVSIAGMTIFAANPLLAADGASADRDILDLSVGVERLGGDTTYRIGGLIVVEGGMSETIHFPISGLEWPFDFWLGRIDAGVNIGSSWRINGTVRKNISDPGGELEDSDWGIWYLEGYPGTSQNDLDIYSESSISDFDALIVDVNVAWSFLQRGKWTLFTGFGYQYQNFEYEGRLIQQTAYYLDYPFDVVNGDGNVGITYEIDYSMPYVLIGGSVDLIDRYSLTGSFAYAPYVEAEDRDNHLLRSRIAEGDMDGDAFMLNVTAKYNITPSWFILAGFHYTEIDVDGRVEVSVDGVPQLSEDETSESSQMSGNINVGFTF